MNAMFLRVTTLRALVFTKGTFCARYKNWSVVKNSYSFCLDAPLRVSSLEQGRRLFSIFEMKRSNASGDVRQAAVGSKSCHPHSRRLPGGEFNTIVKAHLWDQIYSGSGIAKAD